MVENGRRIDMKAAGFYMSVLATHKKTPGTKPKEQANHGHLLKWMPSQHASLLIPNAQNSTDGSREEGGLSTFVV